MTDRSGRPNRDPDGSLHFDVGRGVRHGIGVCVVGVAGALTSGSLEGAFAFPVRLLVAAVVMLFAAFVYWGAVHLYDHRR